MTSLADKSLEELIDQLFRDPTWHAIRIFNGKYQGNGPLLACVARDHSTSMVDQLTGEASPSAKLRNVLIQALTLNQPHAQPADWDGGYTDDLSDAWLEEQQKTQPAPADDFDDILG